MNSRAITLSPIPSVLNPVSPGAAGSPALSTEGLSPERLSTERPAPLLLAYPRVAQNFFLPAWRLAFENVMAQCYELATRRPAAADQHGGFFGLGGIGDDTRLHLLTVWAIAPTEPDIFIIGGWGDGFGPGHTCPTKDELRRGILGPLCPVPLFV